MVTIWSFLLECLASVDIENLILLVRGLIHLLHCTPFNLGVHAHVPCVAISLAAP